MGGRKTGLHGREVDVGMVVKLATGGGYEEM